MLLSSGNWHRAWLEGAIQAAWKDGEVTSQTGDAGLVRHMNDKNTRLVVVISTPLEQEQVDRIQAVAPDKLEVVFEPDLLPPTRYVADHKGRSDFRWTPEQESRWRGHIGRADILWDFPPAASDGTPGLELTPNLKWIQTSVPGSGSTSNVWAPGFGYSDHNITRSSRGPAHRVRLSGAAQPCQAIASSSSRTTSTPLGSILFR